jgi:hypothetical protein
VHLLVVLLLGSVLAVAPAFGQGARPVDAQVEAMDVQGPSGIVGSGRDDRSVDRLYRAYFLRTASPTEIDYWNTQLRNGWTLNQISQYFASSDEFRTRYGTLGDAAFVDLVYRNVLGRAPEPSGLFYWATLLANGTTRGDVMTGFSDSAEYKTGPSVPTGQPPTTVPTPTVPPTTPPTPPPPGSVPPSSTTTTTTTTRPPQPTGQCSTWPKDATCWPQRDVPGTADYQFWTTHPCTVAARNYYVPGTGPLPMECILTQGGQVADPTMVQWPLYPIYSWWQFWDRWGYHLLETTERLMRQAVTSTDLGNGTWRVDTNCYRVIQAEQIITSARYDSMRSGGRAWPSLEWGIEGHRQKCLSITPGLRTTSYNESYEWNWGLSNYSFDQWYLLSTRYCAQGWNEWRRNEIFDCGGALPPLPW